MFPSGTQGNLKSFLQSYRTMSQDTKEIKLRTRDPSPRHTSWLELFYDLSYVAVLQRLAGLLQHGINWDIFLRTALVFTVVSWSWTVHTLFTNRFETDDWFYRIATFVQMFAILCMAIFVERPSENSINFFSLSYIASQVVLWIMYLRVHLRSPKTKAVTRLFLIGFGLGIAFWLSSLFVHTPFKFIFWIAGLLTSFSTPWVGNRLLTKISIHTGHLMERLTTFTQIVMSEVISGLAIGAAAAQSVHLLLIFFLIFGFVLIAGIWWVYFRFLEAYVFNRQLGSGQIYIYTHAIIWFGLILLSAGINYSLAGTPVNHFVDKLLITGGLFCVLATLEIYKIKALRKEPRPYNFLLFIAFAALLQLLAGRINTYWLTILLTAGFYWFVSIEEKRCARVIAHSYE
jgi:low temperature requirement protein LtrA